MHPSDHITLDLSTTVGDEIESIFERGDSMLILPTLEVDTDGKIVRSQVCLRASAVVAIEPPDRPGTVGHERNMKALDQVGIKDIDEVCAVRMSEGKVFTVEMPFAKVAAGVASLSGCCLVAPSREDFKDPDGNHDGG